MNTTQPVYKRSHPMVPIAAASVIVMSLVGVGVFTGVIPSDMGSQAESSSSTAQSAYYNSAPPPASYEQPAPAPAGAYVPPPSSQPYYPPPSAAPVAAQPLPPAPVAAVDCVACGRVESVQAIEVHQKPTGVGAVAGGVGGALVGNTVGEGRSRTPLTILGAVGGAFAGNAIEKHVRKGVSYRVHVVMDDGSSRTFTAASANAYAAGQRVRVENGGLVAIG